jgi:hypothetical protein
MDLISHAPNFIFTLLLGVIGWLIKTGIHQTINQQKEDLSRVDGEIKTIREDCVYKDTCEVCQRNMDNRLSRIEEKIDRLLDRRS